jgi:ATP-dependent Clp protease protease subunit
MEDEEVVAERRIMGLLGEIDDENTKELLGSILTYLHDPTNPPTLEQDPVELIISTGGGQVAHMFAIYDLLRLLRAETPVSTLGVGKVMSAGVLLLAAGTKGYRRIGKHCRIMLHHVMTSEQGSIADLGTTYKEATVMEKLMFEALIAETSLTSPQLKRMVQHNTDKFFSAEEAVKMGIADVIV